MRLFFSERLQNDRVPPNHHGGLCCCTAPRWSLGSRGERLDAAESTQSEGHGGSLKSNPRGGGGRRPALANEIWVLAGIHLIPTGLGQNVARETTPGARRVVLCEHVRGRGDGDELPEDVLGHLDIVLCNHQCFLDVLVGVTLTHQVFDL